MEQASEEHFPEKENVEKVESTEESASQKKSEDQTEIVKKDEVVVEDDTTSVEDEAEEASVSQASETAADEEEEVKQPDETPEVKKEPEIVEENNNAENIEIIENVDENDNSNAQLKESTEAVADDSRKVESIVTNSNTESVVIDRIPTKVEESKKVVEIPAEKESSDQVDKVEVVEETKKAAEIPTTKTVSNISTVESFEKRIENLNISSVSENLIAEEKDIKNFKENEKGIVEIRKIERTEEKENKLYAENPSNPTSSYLHKIFTPAEEDAPTPKNRQSEYIEEEISQDNKPANFPLKVVMNPRGKVRDLSSLPNEELFSDTGLLSPDKCKELVSALNEPKGKGAELFAKRRKRAEKWAAEDDIQENQRGFYQKQEPFYQQPQEQFYEQKQQSEIYHQQQQSLYKEQPKPFIQNQPEYYNKASNNSYQGSEQQYNQAYNNVHQVNEQPLSYQPNKPSSQRDLAYKPNVAQGWKSRPINLPTDMYVPKEISLDSYHVPPSTDNFISKPSYMDKPVSGSSYLDKPVSVPVPSFRNKNPWLQTNGNGQATVPQNQTYFKVKSDPITSPWHEMERQTPKAAPQSPWSKPQAQHQPSYDFKTQNQPHYQPAQPQYQPVQQQYQYQQPSQQTQYRGQPKSYSNDIYNQNFNTAARGWNGSKMGHCYKPITFGQQPKKANCIQYTDF